MNERIIDGRTALIFEYLAAGGPTSMSPARLDGVDLAKYRRGVARGRPLGSDRFIAKLEATLNRRLRPHPRGRPRKPKPTTQERRDRVE